MNVLGERCEALSLVLTGAPQPGAPHLVHVSTCDDFDPHATVALHHEVQRLLLVARFAVDREGFGFLGKRWKGHCVRARRDLALVVCVLELPFDLDQSWFPLFCLVLLLIMWRPHFGCWLLHCRHL